MHLLRLPQSRDGVIGAVAIALTFELLVSLGKVLPLERLGHLSNQLFISLSTF